MYHMYLYVPGRTIVIEHAGKTIASQGLPNQEDMFPSEKVLLAESANQAAYDAVAGMVACANAGAEILAINPGAGGQRPRFDG